MCDLREVGPNKEAMKEAVAATYPFATPGAIPIWAGVLLRFAFEMKPGDLVIYPYKPDSTSNFGRIEGDYYFEAGAEQHRTRRRVRVKNHAEEFEAFMNGTAPPLAVPRHAGMVEPDEAAANAEDEPSAERIEAYTRDYIVDTLLNQIGPQRFEEFVAGLLEAMGYRARVTPPVGRRRLRCDRTPGSRPLRAWARLSSSRSLGTLAPGGSDELGLFVTLGSYSKDAQHLGRTRQDLRLINGTELVELVFDHYEQLGPEWKRLLPLRRMYVVDEEPQGT